MRDKRSADPQQLLKQGEAIVRRGRAMIGAAKAMIADGVTPPSQQGFAPIDFDLLPGRSAEGRAEALYVGRRIRDRLFPDNLFGEPAWDLLLTLLLAHPKHLASDAIFREIGISQSTGLRYLLSLEALGLIDMDAAPPEKLVSLSRAGSRLMYRFFEMSDGSALVSPMGFQSVRRVS